MLIALGYFFWVDRPPNRLPQEINGWGLDAIFYSRAATKSLASWPQVSWDPPSVRHFSL